MWSAESAPEKGQTASVVALADGSLPVSSAEFLASRWELRAKTIEQECQHLSATFMGITAMMQSKARMLKEWAEEVRRSITGNVRRFDLVDGDTVRITGCRRRIPFRVRPTRC